MADKIDKLAQVIHNDFKQQDRRLSELISVIKQQHTPQIKVGSPIIPEVKVPPINIPEPKVDLTGVAEALKSLNKKDKSIKLDKIEKLLKKLVKKEQTKDSSEEVLKEIHKAIKEIEIPEQEKADFSEVIDAIKRIRVTGHGGISSKRNILDTSGKAINPSVSETVSVSNSSTTAINNGDNFTGDWEDTNGYSSVKIAVTTDQNGYYQIQWSPDGTNADSTLTRYYRTTQIEPPHKFENMRQYVRVRFFNDSGSNQTYFRLQTTLTSSAGLLNIPLDGTVSQDYDAIATRPTDFHNEVALGRRQGYTLWNKFGYNEDVDTATDPEVLAAFGGSFTPLTTASTLTVVSSSTDDDGDPAGIGAQTIRVIGVDANRDQQTEDITMDGTTNVVTTSTWLGINRVIVLTSGSSDSNVGLITITATTGGSTQATLPAGESVTQQLIFFIPNSHTGLASWLRLTAKRFGSGTEPVVTFKGWVYSPLTDTKYEVFREVIDAADETHSDLTPSRPFVFTEQDVFWVEAETTRDDTQVIGRLTLETVRHVDA